MASSNPTTPAAGQGSWDTLPCSLTGSVAQGAQPDGKGCSYVPTASVGLCRTSTSLHPLPPTQAQCRTSAEVPKDVIALLREGDLVHSMPDVASLQQIAGIFAGFATVCKAFHMVIEPIHHIRTCHQTSELNTARQRKTAALEAVGHAGAKTKWAKKGLAQPKVQFVTLVRSTVSLQ